VPWFAVFLNLFALGILGAIALVPFREIGRYYFRFHAMMALVLVTGAVLLGQPWKGWSAAPPVARATGIAALAFAAAVLLENVLVRAVRTDLRSDALLLPASLGVPFVAMTAFALSIKTYGVGASLLLTAHLLTSAAVLGTALVAMTTGHWYLANAKLPFDILVRLCRLFVLSVAAKAAVSAAYGVGRFDAYWGLEDFDKLVMGVRLSAGIVLAMILGIMSLSCAKRKANQSATGILYVAVVFVLIGETISMYLTLGAGRPL